MPVSPEMERRTHYRRREDQAACPLDREDCPHYNREREVYTNGKKEPLFTTFASALIGVLALIIIAMASYWAHYITQQTTSNVIEINELKKSDAVVAAGLAAINIQLSELRGQISARPPSIYQGRN